MSGAWSLRGRTIAVTGGLGMVGSHTVDRLVAAGARVRALDRPGHAARRDRVPTGVELVEADVRDRVALRELVAGADTVVHLAAVLSETATRDPWLAMDVNVTGTRRLLEVAAGAGVRRVVHGSSVAVYGQPESDVVLTEDSAFSRPSVYGAAKLAAESYVRAWAAGGSRSARILRLGTLYSERAHTGGFHLRELTTIAETLARDERTLTVRGDPAEVLDLLHAADAAEVIARCCDRTEVRTLNVVSGVPVTWREVVLALVEAGGGATDIVWDASVTNWAAGRRFSPARAEAELGTVAAVSLADGMARLSGAAGALVASGGSWS